MDPRRLQGRTALVTGAAYGIGYAAAERLAAEGANVVISDIKGHEDAAEHLAHKFPNVRAAAIDVRDDASVAAGVQETVRAFGSLDILVNNAAISAELHPGPFEDQSVDDWRRISEVNRSEERRVGKECVRTWRSRWSPVQ